MFINHVVFVVGDAAAASVVAIVVIILPTMALQSAERLQSKMIMAIYVICKCFLDQSNESVCGKYDCLYCIVLW